MIEWAVGGGRNHSDRNTVLRELCSNIKSRDLGVKENFSCVILRSGIGV